MFICSFISMANVRKVFLCGMGLVGAESLDLIEAVLFVDLHK